MTWPIPTTPHSVETEIDQPLSLVLRPSTLAGLSITRAHYVSYIHHFVSILGHHDRHVDVA